MKKYVVGAFDGYDFGKVAVWCNSLKATGYFDDQENWAMLVVGPSVSEETIRLVEAVHDQMIVIPCPDLNERAVVVSRFKAYDLMCRTMLQNSNNINYEAFIGCGSGVMLLTDVRDVAFQINPAYTMEELKQWHSWEFLTSSPEQLLYQHEEWGVDNMKNSFPMEANAMMHEPIYNAGVIMGSVRAIRYLCTAIYNLSTKSQLFNPDQAAYNILIHRLKNDPDNWDLGSMNSVPLVPSWTEHHFLACQAGTQVDPSKIDRFRPHLLIDYNPRIGSMGVETESGIVYTLVHQYDRVPEWKRYFEDKYGIKK